MNSSTPGSNRRAGVGAAGMSLKAMLSVAVLLLAGYQFADGCQAPIVEILVSPLVDKQTIRVMDLVWDVGAKWKAGDWVGLYKEQPNANSKPEFSANVNQFSGSVRTGVQEGRKLPEPNFQTRCLGWWAAYWHQNNPNPVVVSCLGTKPRWMEEYKAEIGNMTLNNMFLPGTHDSGSFLLSYSPFQSNRIDKYIYTQDESIIEQLIHGVRILDLRIAYHENQFWINHGIASLHPWEYVISDIKKFVESTNEIVILDIHEFLEGFKKKEIHYKFIDDIRSRIGDLMVPPYVGWSVPLNHLWQMNKRIIVAYNDKEIVKERIVDVFWPVQQKWGNKRSVNELYNYFASIFNPGFNSRGQLWCAMAEMTPNTWDVISDKLKGLRVMADSSNKDVSAWFRGTWGKTANAVSVDFVRSTGIVDAAIRWNRRRAAGRTCD